MAFGLLNRLEPEDSAQIGLLGLMGLGQTIGANRRRYAVGQIPEAGPGPTAWVPEAVRGVRDIRNYALIKQQAEEQRKRSDMLNRLTEAQIGQMQARDTSPIVGRPGDVFLDRNSLTPRFQVPDKPDYLSPEAEAQRMRMAAAGREPQLLPADVEAQRIRMAAAGRDPRMLSPEEEAQRIRMAREARVEPQPPRLDTGARKELSDRGGVAKTFENLTSNWKDDFGGYKSSAIGELNMSYQRYLGGDKSGAANWWQEYQAQKNLVRNQLFGSALTVTERNEFDKAQIDPGMKPELIKKNLARQNELAKVAAAKLAKSYLADGYRPEAVEAALGIKLDELGAGRIVEDGYEFLGGDKADPKNWKKL